MDRFSARRSVVKVVLETLSLAVVVMFARSLCVVCGWGARLARPIQRFRVALEVVRAGAALDQCSQRATVVSVTGWLLVVLVEPGAWFVIHAATCSQGVPKRALPTGRSRLSAMRLTPRSLAYV